MGIYATCKGSTQIGHQSLSPPDSFHISLYATCVSHFILQFHSLVLVYTDTITLPPTTLVLVWLLSLIRTSVKMSIITFELHGNLHFNSPWNLDTFSDGLSPVCFYPRITNRKYCQCCMLKFQFFGFC